jgi:hypothetical protein
VLAATLHDIPSPPGDWPERVYAQRPNTPRLASYAALAAVLAAALSTAGAVVRAVKR